MCKCDGRPFYYDFAIAYARKDSNSCDLPFFEKILSNFNLKLLLVCGVWISSSTKRNIQDSFIFICQKDFLNRYPSLTSYISGMCSCYTKYDIQFAHYSGIIKASKTLSIPLICFDRLLLSFIFHEKEFLIYFVIEGSILFFVTITLLLLLPVFV